MTMHLMGPAFSTTGKKKGKKKFKSAAHAAQAKANAENWKQLLEKYDVKPQKRKDAQVTRKHSDVTIFRREPGTSSIPSLDTGVGNTSKHNIPVYTGNAMIGIGQLHKSNAVPIFSQEDAIDISKMRRN